MFIFYIFIYYIFELLTSFYNIHFQIYEMSEELFKEKSTWKQSNCDVYVILLNGEDEEFSAHADVSHFHTQDSAGVYRPHPFWNYNAKFIFIFPTEQPIQFTERIATLYNLRKTKNVLFVSPRNGRFYLTTHSMYSEKLIVHIDVWENGEFIRNNELFPKKYEDFKGFTLNVATFDHPPSVVYTYDDDNVIKNRFGVDMQIVQTVAKAMNFRLNFIEVSKKERWGYQMSNGTWTGLVGQLYYEKADLGVCNVFMVEKRWNQIRYTAPYNFERGCFVAPAPKPLSRWMSPALPFAQATWLSIGLTVLAGGAVLFILVNLGIRKESMAFSSIAYDYLYIIGLVSMKSQDIIPKYQPTRIYIGFFWLFCLIISTAYSANLVAFLSVTQMSAPIDTLKQLKESPLRIGGFVFWKTQFAPSIDANVRSFVDRLESDLDFENLFDDVEKGEFSLIENKQYLELIIASRYTYGNRATIRIVKECLLPYNIGLGLQKFSPLQETMNKVILRLFESGVLGYWKKEVIDFFKDLNKDKRGTADDVDLVSSLSIDHLQGVFIIYSLGLFLALIIFLFELIPRIFERKESN